MLRVQLVGEIPEKYNSEIEHFCRMCEHGRFNPFQNGRWKKVTGLKKAYSYRLSANHRILYLVDRLFFVSDHDRYAKKICNIKRGGALR